MKQLTLSALLTLLGFAAAAQCTDCSSLREALKDPLNVRHLDLSNQGLSELPDSVRYMTQLETIDLSDNFFTTVDLKGFQLERVYNLDLSGNIGLDPLELDRAAIAFPNLLKLDLSDCGLAYLAPNIRAFSQLITLDVSGNKLQFLPEDLATLPQLGELDLHDNEIRDITYVLGNCWNLRSLDASRNVFDPNALLISLSMSAGLDRLVLSWGELDREGIQALSGLPVRSLGIVGATTAALPSALARNTAITSLELTDCRFRSDPSPVLEAMTSLQRLSLENTPLPPKLAKVTQLNALTLAGMDYPTNGTLAKLSFLDELDVANLDVSDSLTAELPKLLPATLIRTSLFSYAPEMIENTVAPILAETAVEKQIPGNEPVQVMIDDLAFDVPENAFLNDDGTVYTGEVTLKVTNYDNAITNALSGAPMIMENNGQNEVFASSGMLDFRALDDKGNELKANPASQVQVTMQNQRPNQPANLYTFDEREQKWITDAFTPSPLSADSLRQALIDSINRMDLASFVNFQTVPTLFSLKIRDKRWDPSSLEFHYYNRPRGALSAGPATTRYFDQNYDARAVADRVWRIDTIVTPVLMDKLMEVQCSNRLGKKIRSAKRYDNQPRLIRNLQVTPDIANDNYRMTFDYRDTAFSIPVFLDTKKAQGRSVMVAYARFQKSLDKATVKNNRSKVQYEKDKQEMIAAIAPGVRAGMIRQVMANPNITRIDQLSFSIPRFGLVNCDFFYNKPPDGMAALSDTLTDQNGESIGTPDFVRTILPASNVYLSAARDQIPQYASEKTLLLFLISATEIGLVKLENMVGNRISVFSRFNIAGKSSEEVSNIIREF